NGVTGYSVKYAWRSSATARPERLILVTDRRLDIAAAPSPAAPSSTSAAAAPADAADFTVLEVRFASNGTGDGRTSLTTAAIVDQAAGTIAVDKFDSIPSQLRITP